MTNKKEEGLGKEDNDFLASLTPQERVFHVAAGADALAEKFREMAIAMQEFIPEGDIASYGALVPGRLIFGVAEVMMEMLALLEQHNIVSRKAVHEFIEKKREEMASRAKEEGKPEGWCENCKTVHEDKPGAPSDMPPEVRAALSRILTGGLLGALSRQAGVTPPEDDDTPPPGTKLH